MNHKHQSHRHAFTLIELSIVLVIIGLLVGGVLVGKDLIVTAGLRGYVSQLEQFNTAVNTFKLKYNCLPGDCTNATNFGFTGNGNGNGIIMGITVIGCTGTLDYSAYCPPFPNEFLFTNLNWVTPEAGYMLNHMYRSGLLLSRVTITEANGAYPQDLPMKYDGTGIFITGWNGKHYFRSGVTSFTNNGGVGGTNFSLDFTPSEALYIFTKMNGTTMTLTNSVGTAFPDGLLAGENIIPSGVWSHRPNFLYYPVTQGAGGAGSDVCINNTTTPPSFNVSNPKKLCSLLIRAGF